MKLGWIEISFTWHGPGSVILRKNQIDKKVIQAYNTYPEHMLGRTSSRPARNLIGAIKMHRTLTGMDLKSSKEYCEKVCKHVRNDYVNPHRAYNVMDISYTEQILLNALQLIKSLSATTVIDSGDTRINEIASVAIKQFEEEKERINNIPPYN